MTGPMERNTPGNEPGWTDRQHAESEMAKSIAHWTEEIPKYRAEIEELETSNDPDREEKARQARGWLRYMENALADAQVNVRRNEMRLVKPEDKSAEKIETPEENPPSLTDLEGKDFRTGRRTQSLPEAFAGAEIEQEKHLSETDKEILEEIAAFPAEDVPDDELGARMNFLEKELSFAKKYNREKLVGALESAITAIRQEIKLLKGGGSGGGDGPTGEDESGSLTGLEGRDFRTGRRTQSLPEAFATAEAGRGAPEITMQKPSNIAKAMEEAAYKIGVLTGKIKKVTGETEEEISRLRTPSDINLETQEPELFAERKSKKTKAETETAAYKAGLLLGQIKNRTKKEFGDWKTHMSADARAVSEAAREGSEMLTQAQARMTNPEITLSQEDEKDTQLEVLKHMIGGLDLGSLTKEDLERVRSAILLIDRNLLEQEDDIKYFNELQTRIDDLLVLAKEREKNKKNAFRMAESFAGLDIASMDNKSLRELAVKLEDFLRKYTEDIKSPSNPGVAETLKKVLRQLLAEVQGKLPRATPTASQENKEIPPPLKPGGLVREYGHLGEDARKARIKKMFRYLDQDKLETRKKEFAAELQVKRKQESREARKEARRKKKEGTSQEQRVADRKAEVLAKMTVTENPQEKPVTPKDIMDHVFVTTEQKAEWEACKNKKIRERAVYGRGRGFFIRKYKTVSNLTRNLVMVTNMGPKLGTLFIGRDTYGEYIERALKEAEKMGKLKELLSE